MSDDTAVIEQDIIDKVRDQGTSLVTDKAVNQAKYISAILSSCLGRWLLIHAGTIPIPQITAVKQRPFVRLVDKILEAKAADRDADTSYLEWDIDRLVYDLYGLTEEEDTAIERSLGLIHASDEEEDAAFLKMMLEAEAGDFVSEETVMATLQAVDGN